MWRILEPLRQKLQQPEGPPAGPVGGPADLQRDRELVAPLIKHMVDIAGGQLSLTWDDVKAAQSRSPALGEALAGLLNLDEELRFSEGEQAQVRREQLELSQRLLQQNEELRREREAMAALIRDLSAVMLEIAPGVLLVPLVGSYDLERAQHLTEGILARISAQRIRRLLIDFTGVSVVDTGTAQLFYRLTQSAGLLGASVIAAGIQPPVAAAMVGLGVELRGVEITTGVQEALARCLREAP